MIFGSLMMAIAITISAIAAWYSIAGLVAIFSAAVIPVMIMGGALEAGKIAATVWLHNNWERAGWKFKTYLVPAIVFLMMLTSMGIFGFLSKAHSDQSLVTGDAQSKVAIYDEKIATERDNIAQAKKALEQMNAQVDQMLGRSDTETGAQRAVNIRKQQARERATLNAEITRSQKEIARLQEERAPLAAETRKIEAEVGPIKYIAALIYGDNADQNMLEAAVRWIIILIVVVFDPLALTLILAANRQFEWAREGRGGWLHKEEEHPNVAATNSAGALVEEEVPQPPLDVLNDQAAMNINPEPKGVEIRPWTEEEIAALNKEPEVEPAYLKQWSWRVLGVEPVGPQVAIPEPVEENKIAELYVPKDEDIAAYDDERLVSKFDKEVLSQEEETPIYEDTHLSAEPPLPEDNPVDEFNTPIRRGHDYAVRYKGKIYNLDAFKSLYPGLEIQSDAEQVSAECGFGDKFPLTPAKGEMFIRTDYLPNRLYKWNSYKWVEVDKETTDSYTYNQAYIKHLINKLESGEYEIEDLNEAEQAQVEEQIQDIVRKKNAQ